jgi:hypothetical protein
MVFVLFLVHCSTTVIYGVMISGRLLSSVMAMALESAISPIGQASNLDTNGRAFLGPVCCANDKVADCLAKGRSFKRRNLSTIHPQQGRLVRADHIFRERHRPPPDPHKRSSQAAFFVLRNDYP